MRILVAAILTVGLGVSARAGDIKLTGENTKVEFTGTKKDGKHDGGFKSLTGTVSVTDGNVTSAKIDVTIQTDSLWSDNAGLTQHLKNADFFDVKTNPTSKFVSKSIVADGKTYKVTGDLTLNGKTGSVTFPATITATGGAFTLVADFKIDRTKFGMTYGKGKVDDEVALRVKVDAK
jgi:polyisoprenoid-binding protein YceI